MLTNLFSIFDTHLFALSPFMFSLVMLLIIVNFKTLSYSLHNTNSVAVFLMKQITLQFSPSAEDMTSPKKNIKSMTSKKMFLIMMLSILFLNFFSLFPFILSVTSHMSFNLTLTLILWAMSVALGILSNPFNFFSHLTPSGTPILLMSFMVIIETVSNAIRPMTLAVRLMANMVAGHLLLTLLSKFTLMSGTSTLTSTIPMLILCSLEIGVSIIQSYVITLLCTLYLKESVS